MHGPKGGRRGKTGRRRKRGCGRSSVHMRMRGAGGKGVRTEESAHTRGRARAHERTRGG